jgi:O-antigen ligase
MSTFDEDSYRGKSYAYRKELWPVAKILAAENGTRTLFGHGGQTTETMDLYYMFQNGGSTHHTGFSSWDNNYACDLVEFGYVGLYIEVALYITVLWTLYRATRKMPEEYQNIAAAFTCAAFVYAFSLTNVFMFSPQLKCFFMIAASLGSRMPQLIQEEVTSEVPVPEEAEVPEEEPLVEASPIDPARAHE